MLAQSHESDRTTKKMEVVFEEVFQKANEMPPDPNAREERFPIPWYLRIFYRRRRGRGNLDND